MPFHGPSIVVGVLDSSPMPSASARRFAGSMVTTQAGARLALRRRAVAAEVVVLPTPPVPQQIDLTGGDQVDVGLRAHDHTSSGSSVIAAGVSASRWSRRADSGAEQLWELDALEGRFSASRSICSRCSAASAERSCSGERVDLVVAQAPMIGAECCGVEWSIETVDGGNTALTMTGPRRTPSSSSTAKLVSSVHSPESPRGW